ncbi:hypothetical protein J6590_076898 [Homalodisca vitripennis]|nr:hypothetical protein J6590_076898 [Homalodisca vitripennis]
MTLCNGVADHRTLKFSASYPVDHFRSNCDQNRRSESRRIVLPVLRLRSGAMGLGAMGFGAMKPHPSDMIVHNLSEFQNYYVCSCFVKRGCNVTTPKGVTTDIVAGRGESGERRPQPPPLPHWW